MLHIQALCYIYGLYVTYTGCVSHIQAVCYIYTKLTAGGTASTERDEGAAAIVSIIPAQMTSLHNPFDDDNYEPGKIIGTE